MSSQDEELIAITKRALELTSEALALTERAARIATYGDSSPFSIKAHLGKGPIVIKHFMRDDRSHYATVHYYGPLILCDCHSKTPPYGKKLTAYPTEALFEERGGRRAVHYGMLSCQGFQPREDLTPKEREEKPSPQDGWTLHWW